MERVVRAKIDGWRVVLCVGMKDRLDILSHTDQNCRVLVEGTSTSSI